MVTRLMVAFTVLATPVLAQLPAGWSGRTDKAGAPDIKLAVMGPGFHVTPGSSGIVWRDADKATGKYHAQATFTQTKPVQHPEGYGLIISGSDLSGPNQKYIYFLIRSDGNYLIKQRDGDATTNIKAWTPHDGVVKVDSAGKATNKLEVDANGAKVAFKVNGKTVHEMDMADRAGVVGLRVNHGLDLHIADFAVHKS